MPPVCESGAEADWRALMALHRLKAAALKFDRGFILNLFIAVVAVTTLLLVCYLVFLPSHAKKKGVVRVTPSRHHSPLLRRDQGKGKSISEERRSVLDKIPDFKQSRLLKSVQKKSAKQAAKKQDSSRLLLASSVDANVHHSPATPSTLSSPSSLDSAQYYNLTILPSKHLSSSPHPTLLPASPSPPYISLSSLAKQQCQKEYCSEFLSSDDFSRWKDCSQSAGINNTQTEPQEGRCRFLNQPHREAVALVSFAGSGNTWVRGLLEAATRICTGAVYCDISLRGKGFVGEHTRGGQALVVKTHSLTSEWANTRSKVRVLRDKHGAFGSAILLVRNPFDALVAEWNRKVSNNFRERTTVLDSHTKTAGEEWFGNNSKWDRYVHRQMIRWQDVIKNWLLSNTHYPILVVTYESLKTNFFAEVKKILQFLNVRYDVGGKLEDRLNRTIDAFHRKNHLKNFQHFTTEQRTCINDVLKKVSALVNSTGKAHLLNVQQYITL